VNLKFRDATLDDVPVIAALHNAAAGALTARFGVGHWSTLGSERSAALAQRHARVRVGREGKRILTVLRLATKKPWAIDVSYFTPVKRPLYLTGMAVAVTHHGQGLGRLALDDAALSLRVGPRTRFGSTRTITPRAPASSISSAGMRNAGTSSTRATHSYTSSCYCGEFSSAPTVTDRLRRFSGRTSCEPRTLNTLTALRAAAEPAEP